MDNLGRNIKVGDLNPGDQFSLDVLDDNKFELIEEDELGFNYSLIGDDKNWIQIKRISSYLFEKLHPDIIDYVAPDYEMYRSDSIYLQKSDMKLRWRKFDGI